MFILSTLQQQLWRFGMSDTAGTGAVLVAGGGEIQVVSWTGAGFLWKAWPGGVRVKGTVLFLLLGPGEIPVTFWAGPGWAPKVSKPKLFFPQKAVLGVPPPTKPFGGGLWGRKFPKLFFRGAGIFQKRFKISRGGGLGRQPGFFNPKYGNFFPGLGRRFPRVPSPGRGPQGGGG